MSLPRHSQVHDGHGERALTWRPQTAHILTPPNSVNDHCPILWHTHKLYFCPASLFSSMTSTQFNHLRNSICKLALLWLAKPSALEMRHNASQVAEYWTGVRRRQCFSVSLTRDPETAMSSSVLIDTLTTSSVCPYNTCTGLWDRPTGAPPYINRIS